MMWVLVAIASVELLVTHLLVAAFVGSIVAVILSVLTVAAVGWLVLAIRSMRHLPVEFDAARLVMRAGRIKRLEVPAASIVGVRPTFDAASLKDGATLNLALLSYPNVVIDIDPPMGRRRTIRAVAHRLDDPAAFTQAIGQVVAARCPLNPRRTCLRPGRITLPPRLPRRAHRR